MSQHTHARIQIDAEFFEHFPDQVVFETAEGETMTYEVVRDD